MKNGVFDFEKLIATTEMMNTLKPLARILGPKGFMPNLKVGTLVQQSELENAIRSSKFGKVEFRVDNDRKIVAGVGKINFEDDKLLQNIKSLIVALQDRKPKTVKGDYFTKCYIKTT